MDPKSASDQRPILLLSNRPWNNDLTERVSLQLDRPVKMITSKTGLTYEAVCEINPEWIFVPHWSHLIPESIWANWPTVIFHMTDLPFGRGGSPLQNLIKQGHVTTMLTALECSGSLDAGNVYLKEPMDLHGSAEEIFLRANTLIEAMIERIVLEQPKAMPQQGNPVLFKRRTPAESNLSLCKEGELKDWYDQIRMLDASGYPHAYLEVNGMRLEFRRVSQRSDGLYADVKIIPTSTLETANEEPAS